MQPQKVVEVCQPGFDVNTCPDWAYLFNSNWPSLTIVDEFSITGPTTTTTLVNHTLNFPPLALVYINDTAPNSPYTTGSFFCRMGIGYSITNNQFQMQERLTATQSVVVRLYNIDISKDVSYPLPQNASAKLPYNSNFGLKVVKGQRSIASNNLNDFILHTRGQSPAVYQVATEQGQYFKNVNFVINGVNVSSPAISVPLKTSYMPWSMAFIQQTVGVYTYASINAYLIQNVGNGNNISFALFNSPFKGSLVLLRDPLFYPNTVRVVY